MKAQVARCVTSIKSLMVKFLLFILVLSNVVFITALKADDILAFISGQNKALAAQSTYNGSFEPTVEEASGKLIPVAHDEEFELPPPPKPLDSLEEPVMTAQAKPRFPQGQYHRISTGQTVERIASMYGVKASAIRSANRLPKGKQPFPGQKIWVPSS